MIVSQISTAGEQESRAAVGMTGLVEKGKFCVSGNLFVFDLLVVTVTGMERGEA